MKILITNGLLIDPENAIEKVGNLYIADGKIVHIGAEMPNFDAEHCIDATDHIVCPGLIDLRANLKAPENDPQTILLSESKAAVSAGITTLCCPPDTLTVADNPAAIALIQQHAEENCLLNIHPLGALTHKLEGQRLSEMGALKKAGCIGVSNARRPLANTLVLRRAMEYAATHDLIVFLHAEDADLRANGCIHEGIISSRLGLPGIPAIAEIVAVARDLALIEYLGIRAHFCQLSSATAVRMIGRAQYDGLNVTADVSAHHLHLTEMDIAFFDAQCHVMPPLRSQRDRDGLRQGIVDQIITAVSSDHQPHTRDGKLFPFGETAAGISALETLLPLTLRLVDDQTLSLSAAISQLTNGPAKVLGVNSGTLSVGADADVCIFDPEHIWQVDKDKLLSQGHNTPFHGWDLKGKVSHTLFQGRIVFENNTL